MNSSSVDHHVALARGDGERRDLVLEPTRLLRRLGLVLRAGREPILLLAGQLPLRGDVFRRVAHVIAVEGVGEAVLDHRIDELHVAHLHAVAQMSDVGSLRHRLLSARDYDVGVAVGDLLQSDRHRAEAAATQLIEPERGLLLRNARLHRRLPRRVLAFPGRKNLAEDHLVDLAGLHFRRRQRGLYRSRPQFVSGRIRERAIEGSDCGAFRADDDDLCCRHGGLPGSNRMATTARRRLPLCADFYTSWAGATRRYIAIRPHAAIAPPGSRAPSTARPCDKSMPGAEKRLSYRNPSGSSLTEHLRHVEFNVADHHQKIR